MFHELEVLRNVNSIQMASLFQNDMNNSRELEIIHSVNVPHLLNDGERSSKEFKLNVSSDNVIERNNSSNFMDQTNNNISFNENHKEKLSRKSVNECQIFISDQEMMFSSEKSPLDDSPIALPKMHNGVAAKKQILSKSVLSDDMTPEIAFTQYQRHAENQACQICGQPSVGFHHRAYVCEACKKFFSRHLNTRLKNDKGYSVEKGINDIRIVCPLGGNCKVEGAGRGKCPHCRFRKCLDLGMSLTPPGGEMGCDISKIPCRVCGGSSSGFHFGALTCEGCKGFFRRTVLSTTKPDCLKNHNCLITLSNRNMCKSCRFQRCLEVGMSQKGSRIGRQPNAVKYYCLREISKLVNKGEVIVTRPLGPSKDAGEQIDHATSIKSMTSPTNGGFSMSDWSGSEKLEGYRSRASTFSTSSASSGNSQHHHISAARSQAVKKLLGNSKHENSSIGSRVNGAVSLPPDVVHSPMDSIDGNSPKGSQPFQSYFNTLHGHTSPPVLTSPLVAENDLKSNFLNQITSSSQDWINFVQNPNYHRIPPLSAAAVFTQAAEVCLQQRLFNLQRGGYEESSSAFQPPIYVPPTVPSASMEVTSPPSSSASISVNLAGLRVSAMAAAMIVAKGFSVPDTSLMHIQNNNNNNNNHQQQQQHRNDQELQPPILSYHNQSTHQQQQHASVAANLYTAKQLRVTSSIETAEQAGSQAASQTISMMNTAVTVTLAKFTEGIANAANFLRSERNKLKRKLLEPSPRFTMEEANEVVWEHMMKNFEIHSKMVVSFTKLIPGFNQLELNDRRNLVRAAMYPLMLVHLSRDFNMENRLSYNYFDFSDHERQIILTKFPALNKVASHLVHSGEVFHILKLDDTEMTLICVQELLRHQTDLMDPASCQHLFLLSMQVLVNHEQSVSEPEVASERLTSITQLLPMLNRLNVEHHEVLNSIRLEYPNISFPSLYLEMFAINEPMPPICFQVTKEIEGSCLNS